MKGYVVCVYENVGNLNALKNYSKKAKEAVDKYDGKFLIRGGEKITTEGKVFVRTAVIEFSTFEKAKKFFYSNDYQAAHKILKSDVVRHHQIIKGS
tara:strand:+ start:1913 stop:2200 length:288 start_codon:yes stop_codon:yes gene_type:complete